MAVKYQAGDVFAIPSDAGTYALCQVLWAPQGDYRKVVGFCVLEQQASEPTLGASPTRPLPVRDGDRDIRLLFTGTQKLRSGEWQIVGRAPLPQKRRGVADLPHRRRPARRRQLRADAVGGRVRALSVDVGARIRAGAAAAERQPVIEGAGR